VGYKVQSDDGDARVKTNAGTYRKTGEPQMDVIISESAYPDDHRHTVINHRGDLAYDEYNMNHYPRSN